GPNTEAWPLQRASQQRTETVPAPANEATEYGIDKGAQERLLPHAHPMAPGSGVGQPPATGRGPSGPSTPPRARVRPPRTRRAGSILSQLFTMPTPVSDRPPSVAPALRVAVNGAGSYTAPASRAVTGFPTPVEQRPVQRPINPANHNAAQLAAAAAGKSSYTPAGGGAMMPTRAMNGQLRYTYGDSGSSSNGGSL